MLVFAIAILAGLGAPLAVIQVLLVNLVTDGLPALALARDPASPETMTIAAANEDCSSSTGASGRRCCGSGPGRGRDLRSVRDRPSARRRRRETMAFATLALGELALVYGMRSARPPPGGCREPLAHLSVLVSVALVAALVFAPAAHGPFATVSLDTGQTLLVAALSLCPLVGVESVKAARRRALRSSALPA